MSVYTENGIWRYRFSFKGRRYFESLPGVKTRQHARDAESDRRLRLRNGEESVLSRNVNFRRFVEEEFLPHVQANRSPKTYQSYKWRCDVMIAAFGDLSLPEITSFAVERFRRDQMKRETRPGVKQSASSVNAYGNLLGSIYSRAEKLKIIRATDRPEIESLKEENHRIRYLTFEEEEQLLDAAKIWPYLPDMITVCLATGLRRQELFNLEKSDVDFTLNVVHVMKGKGAKYRRVPLDPSGQARRVLQRRCSESPTNWIFTSARSGRGFGGVDRSLRAACGIAEIDPPITLHILRHTFCTRLCVAGVDVRTVQALAGHKNIETTMRYTHLVESAAHAAIRKLGDFQKDCQNFASGAEKGPLLKLA
jgi:integrase